jgi:hypothetical protein
VEQFFYYRSLSKSPDIWNKGKEVKSFPPDVERETYLSHMTQGKGFPSIWMSSNDDDLEKIALGILLGRDDLQKVQLIGFDPCCFDKTEINVVHAPNPKFPLPSVANLHYELQIDTGINLNTSLTESIELYLQCNGNFKRFLDKKDAKSPKEPDKVIPSMMSILKKYIGEISGENYKRKANLWLEKYGKPKASGS